MGTIGTDVRFKANQYNQNTPGVGQYNIISFKNLTRAAESTFDLGNFKSEYEKYSKGGEILLT